MRLLSFYLHLQAWLLYVSIVLGAGMWISYLLPPFHAIREMWRGIAVFPYVCLLVGFFFAPVVPVMWAVRWGWLCWLTYKDWRASCAN